MKKIMSFASLLITLSFIIHSCTLVEVPDTVASLKLDLPDVPFNYSDTEFPNHFNAKLSKDNTPTKNTLNDHGATLGRVLFYDTRLSINNKVACAGCHFQENAFSDVKAFSEGFEGSKTGRNSMPIFNNRFMEGFFWDNEVKDLEKQVVMPVKDHIEMGLEDEAHLVNKLEKTDFYGELFEKAYGSSDITMDKVKKAMAQFIRSIVSTSSKYDEAYKNGFADFTDIERKGMSLFFKAQCNTCHALETDMEVLLASFKEEELFNNIGRFNNGFEPGFNNVLNNGFDNGFGFEQNETLANIGLEQTYADKGVGALTNNTEDNGKFKIPSIRNIMLTAPYMHDGRFANMDEVLEHYNKDLVLHNNLDFRLRVGGNNYDDAGPGGSFGDPIKFDFSDEDKTALKAFFNTLTDNTLTKDPKYANPFK